MREIQFIADYLVENLYASNYNDAFTLIESMSDEWMSSILTEKRRFKVVSDPETGEKKVVRQQKTPLTHHLSSERGELRSIPGSVNKDSEGNWRVTPPKPREGVFITPMAWHGIMKHGGPYYRPELVQRGLLPRMGPGSDSGIWTKPALHGIGGALRGKKKKKGYKFNEISPVQRFIKQRDLKSEVLSSALSRGRFPDYVPRTDLDNLRRARARATTSESFDDFSNTVIEALLDGGYAYNLNEAYDIFENFSDFEIEQLMNVYFLN